MLSRVLFSFRFLFVMVLLGAVCVPGVAQEKAVVALREDLQLERSDARSWIQRDGKAIERFKAEDAQRKNRGCDVLFVGSSSFRMWSTLTEDMAPLKVVNRGYGGSTIRDILFYYDDLLKPHQPGKIILYVENDFSGSQKDLSVGDAYDWFRIFAQRVRRDFPGVPLYIVSVKPSFARVKELPKQSALNALLREYCAATEGLHFIDVASAMHDAEGNLRKDIFSSDQLHLNRKGYLLWTSIIKPHLVGAPKED